MEGTLRNVRNPSNPSKEKEEKEEREEIALYQSQDRFMVARKQRVKEYHERLRALQKEFSDSEEALHDRLLTAFGFQIQVILLMLRPLLFSSNLAAGSWRGENP